jgi:hypothetical protein
MGLIYFKKVEGDSFYTSPLPSVHVLDVPNVLVQDVHTPPWYHITIEG